MRFELISSQATGCSTLLSTDQTDKRPSAAPKGAGDLND
jgi:hypothetical protein